MESCLIYTKEIDTLRNKFQNTYEKDISKVFKEGIPKEVFTNLVSIYLANGNKNVEDLSKIPLESIYEHFKWSFNSVINKDVLATNIPEYIKPEPGSFADKKKLAYTNNKGEIHLTDWFDSKNPKNSEEIFFTYIYGNTEDSESSQQKKKVFKKLESEHHYTKEKIRTLLLNDSGNFSNLKANMFLLWHEMAHNINDDIHKYPKTSDGKKYDLLNEKAIDIEYKATLFALNLLEINNTNISNILIHSIPIEKDNIYTFYSGGAVGADTEWSNAAKELGINIKHYTTKDYDDLTLEKRTKIDEEYKQVVKILGRRELSTSDSGNKLVRRDMLQADSADAIFAIGTIADNGYVAGGTGYATTRGILRGIPVYLFDQNDNKWKVWDKDSEVFVETAMPKLTPKAATIGTRKINENGKQAIKNILNYTFNIKKPVGNTVIRTIGKDVLNTELPPIIANASKESSIEISKNTKPVLQDSPESKAAKDLSPIERNTISQTIARSFSRRIEEILEADEYKDNLESLKALLKNTNVLDIFKDIKETFNSYNEMSLEDFQDIYGENEGNNLKSLYSKIIQHYNILLKDSLPLIENILGLRIILTDINKENSLSIIGIEQEKTIDEEHSRDAEDGSRAVGNEGWSFNIKMQEMYKLLPTNIKRIISSIPKLDRNNNVVFNLLGEPEYLNAEATYAKILSYSSKIITPDDWSIKTITNEGDSYEYPILEEMKTLHPWIQGVINHLKQHPELNGLFYTYFRQDYIDRVMYNMGLEQPIFSLNQTTETQSAINLFIQNYTKGNVLNTYSIYNKVGKVNKDNAIKLISLIDDYRKASQKNDSEASNILKNILESLGFIISPYNANILNNSNENKSKLLVEIGNLLAYIKNKDGEINLIEECSNWYTNIASIIGVYTEINAELTVRRGDKNYPSYTVPCYAQTLLKKLQSPKYKKSTIEEFKKSNFFWNKKTNSWRFDLMQMIEDDNTGTSYNLDLIDLNNINGIEYSDWDNSDIYKAFITSYFKPGYNRNFTNFAYYPLPVFAEAPAAYFIKLPRFTDTMINGTKISFKEKVLPLLVNVVNQELSRMAVVEKRQDSNVSKIANFDKNGHKFCFFPQLNNYKVIYNNEEMSFKNACIKANNIKDIDGLNKLQKEAITTLMEINFTDFLSSMPDEQNFDSIIVKNIDANKGLNPYEDAIDPLREALEEYYWNSVWANTQIIQLYTSDMAFYKNATDFQKRWKEVYAGGMKLNTNSKYGKKEQKVLILADNIITSSVYNNVKQSLQNAVKQDKITSLDKEIILNKFKNINVTDGQAFRSLSSFKSVLDMMGQWSPDMEKVFTAFKDNNWDMSHFNIVWQAIKPYVYGTKFIPDGTGRDENGDLNYIRVPYQFKNSEFLLLSLYNLIGGVNNKSSKLKGLNKFMEDNGIDCVQFESAVKVGGRGIIDISYSPSKIKKLGFDSFEDLKKYYDKQLEKGKISQKDYNTIIDSLEPTEQEVIDILKANCYIRPDQEKIIATGQFGENKKVGDFRDDVVHVIPYDDYKVQQPNPEHIFDAQSIFGSQGRVLSITDISDNATFSIPGFSNPLAKDEVISLYNSLIVENLLDSAAKVNSKFSSIESLQKILIETVQSNPKYGRDLVEALRIVERIDPITNKTIKTFNLPLSVPSITNSVQEICLSLFKNNISKQYIKGGAAVLVSDFGYTDSLKIEYDEDGKLLGIPCYLPAYSKKFYEPFLKRKTLKNGEESYELDISKLKRAKLDKLIGLRIPTEDKYSMCPLIIKGFLPQQNGGCIVLPADITTIAGSDFDIDKMFLMIPEFKEIKYDYSKAFKDFQEDLKLSKVFQEWFENASNTPAIKNWLEKIGRNLDNEEVIEEDITFKEWFKENKEKYLLQEPIYVKIKYDVKRSPQENSRAQRNNMLIDILHSILTNPDTLDKINNPGNFDGIKREARMAVITDSQEVFEQFKIIAENKGYIKDVNNKEEVYNFLLKTATLEQLNSILDEIKENKNILGLNEYIYNHQQNMAGTKMIGIYATNTVLQGKFQHTNLAINAKNAFVIDGKIISSLSSITSPFGERISKNCAQFSAASVDGVKDPVLKDLLQNMQTANCMGFMLRAGLTIQQATLLFKQPIVKEYILKGKINKLSKRIDSDLKDLFKKYGVNSINNNYELLYRYKKDNDMLLTEVFKNITSEMLLDNILNTENSFESTVNSLLCAALFSHIYELSEKLKEINMISRADSVNNAVANNIAGAYLQDRAVDLVQRKNTFFYYPFTGLDSVITNKEYSTDINVLRESFLSAKMPILQAFYSLGIQFAYQNSSKYFQHTNKNITKVLDYVNDCSSKGKISETLVNAFNKDFIYYVLSGTSLFGNDAEGGTYKNKRDYYLQKFPEDFMSIYNNNKEVLKYPILSKLSIINNNIIFRDSAIKTVESREALKQDFTNMLYSEDPEIVNLVIDLFKYSYYKEQLYFGPNSFGMFFNTEFYLAFPELIDRLNSINKLSQDESFIWNFFHMFMINRGKTIAPIIPMHKENSNGTYAVRNIANKFIEGVYPYINVKVGDDTMVYARLSDPNEGIYTPIKAINNSIGVIYDSNNTLDQILEDYTIKEQSTQIFENMPNNSLIYKNNDIIDKIDTDDTEIIFLEEVETSSTDINPENLDDSLLSENICESKQIKINK